MSDKLGKFFKFEYDTAKRSSDKKPTIIVLGESDKRILGVNLNYVHPRFRDQIVKFVHSKLMKAFVLDSDAIEEILATNQIINQREFDRAFLMYLNEFSEEIVKNQTIKSKTALSKILYGGIRKYDKKKMTKLTEISYK